MRAGDGNRIRMTSLEGSVRQLRRVLTDVLLCKDFCGFWPGARGSIGRKSELLEK
jgi:hypothetical protein